MGNLHSEKMSKSDNPFMDPSVQQAQGGATDASNLPTHTEPAAQTKARDSPFPGEIVPVANSSGGSSAGKPAWKDKQERGIPLSEDDLRAWETDLRKREDGGLANSDGRPKNWPPCKPILRIAIEEDIETEDGKAFVQLLVYCWYANILALFWNFVCVCAYVDAEDDSVSYVFLSLTYFILGVPGSYFIWFRVGYRAVETKSNFLMFLWLVIFLICSLFWAACMVGVPESAMSGIVTMVKLFDGSNESSGIMCLVGFALYSCLFTVMCWIWWKGKLIYSESGGTEKTKETADNAAKLAKAAKKSGVTGV